MLKINILNGWALTSSLFLPEAGLTGELVGKVKIRILVTRATIPKNAQGRVAEFRTKLGKALTLSNGPTRPRAHLGAFRSKNEGRAACPRLRDRAPAGGGGRGPTPRRASGRLYTALPCLGRAEGKRHVLGSGSTIGTVRKQITPEEAAPPQYSKACCRPPRQLCSRRSGQIQAPP